MISGQTIGGRYLLREPLGSGGMSVVWRAEDVLLGREVAVKVLSADVSAHPASLYRLYTEARAAAGLRHDNVVEVYDYGETVTGGVPVPYIVMELVEGRSLNALLSAGPLPWRLAMLVGAQVAAALAAAHDRGVVHRDVKPANVMITAGGVKLVDFGISAAVGASDTDDGEIFGTPAYLAPERLVSGTVRPSTDVYALGLLLYVMLAGRMPWNASTTTQMLMAHRYRDPAPLPAVADLPADVAVLVRQCLAKTPSDRPPAVTAARTLRTAAGLPPLTLLNSFVPRAQTADLPTESATVVLPPPAQAGLRRRILAWPARHRWMTGGALLVSAAIVSLLCWPGAPGQRPVVAAAASPPLTCHVAYSMRTLGKDRAAATVSVTNTAATTVGAWTLSFRLPGGQRLIRGTKARWQQTGDTVEARGVDLKPGVVQTTSFDISYGKTAMLPQSFVLNDVACRFELSVPQPPATPAPSPAAVKTATAKPKSPPQGTIRSDPQPAATPYRRPASPRFKIKRSKPSRGFPVLPGLPGFRH